MLSLFSELIAFLGGVIGNLFSSYSWGDVFNVYALGQNEFVYYVNIGFFQVFVFCFFLILFFKLFGFLIKKLLSLLSAKIKRELEKKKK